MHNLGHIFKEVDSMENRRWWVKFISMWTKTQQIHSFDTEEEAKWFADQVNGEILDWTYES